MIKQFPLGESLICPGCRISDPAFTTLYSLSPYTQEVKEIIHRLKYGRESRIAKCLGAQMALLISSDAPFLVSSRSVIVPVPLTFKKLFRRGFNQSALMAKSLAKLSGIPFFPAGLKRIAEFAPQVEKGEKEREIAMREVFQIDSLNLNEKENIILLDDVATTLSTLNACSREIVNAFGDEINIYGLTAARSLS